MIFLQTGFYRISDASALRYKSFPKMHEVIQIDRFRFKIMKVESNRIELVSLKIEE